jgi:VWFA-related protein
MMRIDTMRPTSCAPSSRLGIAHPIALAACVALALAAAPPTPQGAPLVMVDVAVEGTDGKNVTGLTRDDFEILAGGATRPVESFAAGKEQPLSLVLLLDASVSLEFMVERKVLRTAVEQWFVSKLAPQDRVQVGSFAKQIAIGPPLAGNPRAVLAAVRAALDPPKADTFGPSPIWDAVDAAVAVLAQASGRRAVVLVTDGRASGNRQGPEESGARAIAAGVIVNVVGEDWEMTLRQDGKTGVIVRPGAALEWIANATGGLYVQDTATPTAPGPILGRLLDDLQERYTLGFAAAVRDGNAHPLDVHVKRPGLKVRTRRSYVAPAAQ